MLIVIRVVVLLGLMIPGLSHSHTASFLVSTRPQRPAKLSKRSQAAIQHAPIMTLRSEVLAGLITMSRQSRLEPGQGDGTCSFPLGKWECTTTTKCSMPPARADTFPCSWQRRGRLSAGFSKRACPRAPDNAAAVAGKSGSRRSILWHKTTLLKQKRPS